MNPHAAAFAAIHARQTGSAKRTSGTAGANSRPTGGSGRGQVGQPPSYPQLHSQGVGALPHYPVSSAPVAQYPPPGSVGAGYSYGVPYFTAPPPPPVNYPQHPPYAPSSQYFTSQQYSTPQQQFISPPTPMMVSHYSYPLPASYSMGTPQQTHPPARKREVFFCEPCEKEFFNRNAFEAHKNTHEKCNHPGCSFSATKKLVVAHFHSAHGQFSGSGYKEIEVEGMKFRVLLGTDPEEIQQWRAERRSRFPTAANIMKKTETLQQLKDAGGLEPTKTSMRGSIQRKRKQRPDSTGEKFPRLEEIQRTESTTNHTGQPPMSNDTKETVESSLSESQSQADAGNTAVLSGDKRSSIPCKFNYKGKTCSKGDDCPFSHLVEPELCKRFISTGRCSRGSKCLFVHDKEVMRETRKQNDGVKEAAITDRRNKLFLPDPNKGNLLRKLLASEIEGEESLVLQALQYLRQKSYFQCS